MGAKRAAGLQKGTKGAGARAGAGGRGLARRGSGARSRGLAFLGLRRRAARGRAGGKRSGSLSTASSGSQLWGVGGAPAPTSALGTYWCFSRVWRKRILQPCSAHKDVPDGEVSGVSGKASQGR